MQTNYNVLLLIDILKDFAQFNVFDKVVAETLIGKLFLIC